MDATTKDDDSVVGDECHIVAKSPGGPRADPTIASEVIDSHSNLILLCKVHHKMVDDQPNTYTIDKLRMFKREHEQWVRDTLQSTSNGGGRLHIAPRIRTGKDILSLVIGADAYDFSHDELVDEEELELVSWFVQQLQDWGDFGLEFEVGDRVRAGFELSQYIGELEQVGFGVFGALERRKYRIFDKVEPLSVAVVRVVRLSNSDDVEAVGESVEGKRIQSGAP